MLEVYVLVCYMVQTFLPTLLGRAWMNLNCPYAFQIALVGGSGIHVFDRAMAMIKSSSSSRIPSARLYSLGRRGADNERADPLACSEGPPSVRIGRPTLL